jgi:hypothetical protein
MQSWKQILVGTGIGFICILAYVWYTRYTRQKPWNTAAITAGFSRLETDGDDDRLVFSYVLQNNTDRDYRVDASSLPLAGVLTPNSLSGLGFVKFRDESIFIPARERGVVSLILPDYRYPPSVKPGSGDEQIALAGYVDENLAWLKGFAAYDVVLRYQINFPNGWHHEQLDETTSPEPPTSQVAPHLGGSFATVQQPAGESQLKLARQYLDGNVQTRNPVAALPLLWSAVEKGNSTAETILADLYLAGEGVARNCDQARVLLSAASGKGNEEARQKLEDLNRIGCR